MPDWPFLNQRELVTITSYSPEAMGPQLTAWNLAWAPASAVWNVSNAGLFVPITLRQSISISQLFSYNGSSVSGHLDLGVYSEDGIRLLSTGSTVQSGTSAVQAIAVAPKTIGPGRFYMAMVMDNNVGTILRVAAGSAANARFFGQNTIQNVFPLPPTVTLATSAVIQQLMMFGLTGKALI